MYFYVTTSANLFNGIVNNVAKRQEIKDNLSFGKAILSLMLVLTEQERVTC